MNESEQTDYDNGFRGYYAGVPFHYYDYSAASVAGYKAAEKEHKAAMDMCDF